MESYCSCGAQLVAGARFCHRCGKPTSEEPIPEAAEVQPAETPVVAPPAPAAPPAPQPISFRNILAVRVSVLSASLMYLLTTVTAMAVQAIGLPVLQFLAIIGSTMVSGGFSVYLYRRSSGHPVPSNGGARIGWMTGVFAFVLTTVLFTLGVLLLSGEGGFSAMYKQSLASMKMPEDAMNRIKDLLENPSVMAVMIVLILALQFMFITLLSALGGVLGARFLNQGRTRSN